MEVQGKIKVIGQTQLQHPTILLFLLIHP